MKISKVLVAIVIACVALLLPLSAQSASSKSDNSKDVEFFEIPTGAYNFDPAHTSIGFAIEHLGISFVEGRFTKFDGTLNFDADDFSKSSAEFTAEIESIHTGVAPRDEHLRSADFFEAEKYPQMTFKSNKITKLGGTNYQMEGELTIKGVTKQIVFPFELKGAITDPWGNTRVGAQARTKLDRRDFGITYGNVLPNGALDVANDVEVHLFIEAFQAPAEDSK